MLTRSDHEHIMKLLQAISLDLCSHIYVAISLYTALIWSAKGYLRYLNCTHLNESGYLFEECYFGAIMASTK